MNYEQLRYFVTVAECLNFTKAAERLYITQPGLTRQISNLERSLNVTLFDRSKRAISLTLAGHVLLKEAYLILQNRDRVIYELQQQSFHEDIYNLTIGYSGWLEAFYFPGFIKGFIEGNPNVNIFLKNKNLFKCIEDLYKMEIDVVLGFFTGYESMVDLCSEYLSPVYSVLVVNPRHHFADKKSISISEIGDEPIISVYRSLHPFVIDILNKMFSDKGIVLNNVRNVDSMSDYFTLIRAGIGAGISCSLYEHVEAEHLGLRFIPIHDHDLFEYRMLWKEGITTRAISAFSREIKAYIKEHPPVFSY